MKQQKILPKGFSYHTSKRVEKDNIVLSKFLDSTHSLYSELVAFPPVAFSDTFTSVANITGDKVYEFHDKKGREIMLTPDSQAHLLNFKSHQENQRKPSRFSWVSPVFRYRNAPVRYYNQIGFASINHIKDDEIFELFLCIAQLVNFIHSVTKEEVIIEIMNVAILKEMLDKNFSNSTYSSELFEKLRRLTKIERLTFVSSLALHSEAKKDVVNILSGDANSFSDLTRLKQYDEYNKTFELVSLLKAISNMQIKIKLDNIYCSEIMSGAGFTLNIGKDKIGDGGVYDKYASSFSTTLSTYISVCTGINPMTRHLKDLTEHTRIIVVTELLTKDVYSLIESLMKKDNTLELRKTMRDILKNEQFDLVVRLLGVRKRMFTGLIYNQKSSLVDKFTNFSLEEASHLIQELIAV